MHPTRSGFSSRVMTTTSLLGYYADDFDRRIAAGHARPDDSEQNTLTLAERTIERMIDRSVASTIVYSSLLYFSLESSA